MSRAPRSMLSRETAEAIDADLTKHFTQGAVILKTTGSVPHDPKAVHFDASSFFKHLELG